MALTEEEKKWLWNSIKKSSEMELATRNKIETGVKKECVDHISETLKICERNSKMDRNERRQISEKKAYVPHWQDDSIKEDE